MKKGLSFALALVIMLTLLGCHVSTAKTQCYFNATVLETGDGSLKVRCTAPYNSNIPVDAECFVSTDVVAATGAPEMAVNDQIRVVFDGDVMESDPLQIGTVFSIYRLDENGDVIPND